MNKKTVYTVTPIVYAAAVVGSLFISSKVFVIVAVVGAFGVAAAYALTGRRDR